MPSSRRHITARIREFKIPPVHDGLILGREAAIGCVALRQALGLLSSSAYAHIEIDDDVISDILLKEGVLRRIPREQMIRFVLHKIKPYMSPGEILHVEVGAEVEVELELGP